MVLFISNWPIAPFKSINRLAFMQWSTIYKTKPKISFWSQGILQSSLTWKSLSSFFHFPSAGVINVIHSNPLRKRTVIHVVYLNIPTGSFCRVSVPRFFVLGIKFRSPVLSTLYKQSTFERLPQFSREFANRRMDASNPLDLYIFTACDATTVLHLQGGHHKIRWDLQYQNLTLILRIEVTIYCDLFHL